MYLIHLKYIMVVAACRDGYFGSSCNPCPPGFYGVECAGRCFPECADVDCDSVSGCLNNTGKRKNTKYSLIPFNFCDVGICKNVVHFR